MCALLNYYIPYLKPHSNLYMDCLQGHAQSLYNDHEVAGVKKYPIHYRMHCLPIPAFEVRSIGNKELNNYLNVTVNYL